MQRVKTATATTEKPAYSAEGTPGYFRSGDAVAAIPATVPGQDWFNMIQEEPLNVILAAGLTPDPEDDTQLLQAVLLLIAAHAPTIGQATTEDSGIARIATTAEVLVGEGNNTIVTPEDLAAAIALARVESLWLGSGAMIPSATNGASASTVEELNYKLMEDVLDFSASVDQSAQAIFQLPANWDRGTIKAKLHWRPGASGATAGHYVGWVLSVGSVGDGDTVDRALGASVTVADQVLAGLEAVEHVTAASVALTIGGVPNIGDRLHLKIARDADYTGGGTAMTVAARLLGIELQYTTTGNAAAW